MSKETHPGCRHKCQAWALMPEIDALAAQLGAMREALKTAANIFDDMVKVGAIGPKEDYRAYYVGDEMEALQPIRDALSTKPPAALAALETRVWNEAVEACAKVADEFGWILPLYENAEVNEASDDAAESVREQIAAAIRSLKRSQEDG